MQSLGGEVCSVFLPFGTTRDNVFHSCATFGWYASNHFPRNVELYDAQLMESGRPGRPPSPLGGKVSNQDSCNAFKADGSSNGAEAVISDHVEYDIRSFGSGSYEYGDVIYVNARIDGRTCLYQKTYYRSPGTRPFCTKCELVAYVQPLTPNPSASLKR